jgi:hypothetical protein
MHEFNKHAVYSEACGGRVWVSEYTLNSHTGQTTTILTLVRRQEGQHLRGLLWREIQITS